MILRSGRIRGRDGHAAVVEVEPSAGCERCEAGRGCGQGLLFRWFTGNRPVRLRMLLASEARVGSPVTVRIDPRELDRAALTAYGLPLALLLSGLGVGTAVAGEAGAALLGLVGLAAAVPLVRRAGRRAIGSLRAGLHHG